MKEGVLFEITKDSLETGLRGVPAGYCVTSSVDPAKGLFYVDTPIAELAYRDPVEVIYLLYHGKLGGKEEVKKFQAELNKRAFCRSETMRHIELLPKGGSPMDAFSAALLIVGMCEGCDDYREDCLNIIAKIPIIAAAIINHYEGVKSPPSSDPSLGYMENFVHMLSSGKGSRLQSTAQLIAVMRLFNVLHFDHCGGNLSAFVGKAIASGMENMYGSLAGAMTALAGPRHGRANQDCFEFVRSVLRDAGEHAEAADIELLIRNKLKNNELLFGFGHAVLRIEDPRATVCYNYCQQHFPDHPFIKIALLLRTEGSRILKENQAISDPYPNVDAITGSMLFAAGFSYPQYFTILFGLSRMVGIAIQIVYERLEARGGKGTPLVRPSYFYKPRKL